jgi:hypothetical protein
MKSFSRKVQQVSGYQSDDTNKSDNTYNSAITNTSYNTKTMTPVEINPGRAQAIQSKQEKDIAKLNNHIQLLRQTYDDALKCIESLRRL